LKFSSFISRRIRRNQAGSFSATVARIGVTSIAIGIAVGIVSFGVLLGFKDVIQKKLFLFGSHLRVNAFAPGNHYEEGPLPLYSTLSENLNQIPEVRHWQAVAHLSAILKTPDELKGIIFKGVGKDYDWEMLGQSIISGRPLTLPDSGYSNEVVLSKKIATQLRLQPGDDVLVYFVRNPPRTRKLTVAGIYQTDMEEFDNTLILGDLGLIQRLNNWGPDTVGTYEIYLQDFQNIDAAADKIEEMADFSMYIQKVTHIFSPVFEWLGMLDTNTAVFLTLILFVACFNMISVLLVMIMERTPLIGLLKTLGSPDRQIRYIFLKVGLYIVSMGMLIGNTLGLGLCWLQYKFKLIPLDPVNYFMDTVPIIFDWNIIILINLLTLLLVALVLVIPTLVISKIQPVRALLFKK
jgi:lipoprotein-releasing system permease protein